MKMTSTTAHSQASQAAASGIAGDAYVASLNVTLTGDGTPQQVRLGGCAFETLMTVLEMRASAFEPRTREFRPHRIAARTLMQRIDRLHAVLDAMPALADAASRLRDIAEMSDHVAWSAV